MRYEVVVEWHHLVPVTTPSGFTIPMRHRPRGSRPAPLFYVDALDDESAISVAMSILDFPLESMATVVVRQAPLETDARAN